MPLDDSTIERVLIVTAHPDDVDFGAAGTVATWTAQGIEVTYCIVTDGDAGGFDPSVARDQIGLIRQHEQTAAAKQVGVDNLIFWVSATAIWSRRCSYARPSAASSVR